MQHTLHDHIIFLEQKIQTLKDQLTVSNRGPIEMEHISAEIQTAELALLYYRRAFELENRTSQVVRMDRAATSPENAASSPSNDLPGRDRDSCRQLLHRFFEATDRLLFGELEASLSRAAS
jgi:hypothetical protein